MRMKLASRSLGQLAQRGLSMVELMVGITVGLIVTAGAAMVATKQINEHRRLMLEVQLQQDLRIAADLLQRDFRRAGYRGAPASGVWEPAHVENGLMVPAIEAASSPYAEVDHTLGTSEIYYRYAKPATGTTAMNESNVLQDNEKFGIKLSNKTLFIKLGEVGGQANWQAITDPDSVSIESFEPNVVAQQIPLDDVCNCPAGPGSCPTQTVRRVNFKIVGVAKFDSSVKRTLTVSEKIRTDDLSEVCQ